MCEGGLGGGTPTWASGVSLFTRGGPMGLRAEPSPAAPMGPLRI